MKSMFKKYSIQKMNEEIKNMIKDDSVNNLKLFIAGDEAKLSVTLRPMDEYKDHYHGLHPKFDDKLLDRLLFHNNVTSANDFWDMISREQSNHNYMNLIFENKNNDFDYFSKEAKNNVEQTLLGRAVLNMASHFGFRFKAPRHILREIQKDLCNLWEENTPSFTQSILQVDEDGIIKTIYWRINFIESYIDFLGIWPYHIIDELVKAYYVYEDKLNELVIDKHSKSISNNEKKLNLSNILKFKLKDKGDFRLRTSVVYYSGVMPRVMKMEYINNPICSNEVKYLVFHVVRTTYATVNFMDNPKIINHPFFLNDSIDDTRYKQMLKFDLHEDQIQQKYLYDNLENKSNLTQREYEESEIYNINDYLRHSFNTHTIAVSANIETKDNYLMLGKRGNVAIDAGEYYCSVNGQSEFRDEEVSFYRTSVFEDLPSMDYDSKYRVDLNNEIERESIAELGLSTYNREWKYYGVSYLSINNYKTKDSIPMNQLSAGNIKSRRMHFNVLTANSTPLNFEDILKSYEYATEKFENDLIKGLRTNIYKNKVDLGKKRFYLAYDWFYLNKSKIFLFFLFSSIILSKDNEAKLNLSNIFDISFLFIYLITLITHWHRNRHMRKKKINKSFLVTKYIDKDNLLNMKDVFDDLAIKMKQGKEKEKLHAIFRVMYILHFLDKAE